MSKASFTKLAGAVKTSGLHPEPIEAALDEHLGKGKIPAGAIATLAFEFGAQTKAKGVDIKDTERLLSAIATKTRSPVLVDSLRARM